MSSEKPPEPKRGLGGTLVIQQSPLAPEVVPPAAAKPASQPSPNSMTLRGYGEPAPQAPPVPVHGQVNLDQAALAPPGASATVAASASVMIAAEGAWQPLPPGVAGAPAPHYAQTGGVGGHAQPGHAAMGAPAHPPAASWGAQANPAQHALSPGHTGVPATWGAAPNPAEPPRAAYPSAPPASPAASAVPGCLHGYPVSIRQPGFFSAVKLSLRTFPFALFRFVQSCFFAGVSALLLGSVVGVSVLLMTHVHRYAGIGAMLVGLVAWALLWLPFVERKTFAAHCGHIAILTELISKGRISNGQQGMFKFGKELVRTRLGELETIWDVYRAVNRAVRKLKNVVNLADRVLPIDLSVLHRIINRVVGWASPYITSVVLSYGIARESNNFGEAGMDGLCYSAQNAKTLVRTALAVLLLHWVLLLPWWLFALAAFVPAMFYVTFLALGGDLTRLQQNPNALLGSDPMPLLLAIAAGLLVGGLFAALTVKTVKESFVKPVLTSMMLIKFHLAVENQPLDAGLRERVLALDGGLASLSRMSSSAHRMLNVAS